tara:strand:+ start:3463 stop:3858 length:396 start_codon:yes stop_codon:yes gene_type:complete
MKIIQTASFKKIAYRIDAKTKRALGKSLQQHGLDEMTSFSSPGPMLQAIVDACEPFGLIPQDLGHLNLPSADPGANEIGEQDGRANIELTMKDPASNDPFDPGEQVGNARIVFSWLFKPHIDAYKGLAYVG